jgi:hypothetical protein
MIIVIEHVDEVLDNHIEAAEAQHATDLEQLSLPLLPCKHVVERPIRDTSSKLVA